jgi:hypothetical protein
LSKIFNFLLDYLYSYSLSKERAIYLPHPDPLLARRGKKIGMSSPSKERGDGVENFEVTRRRDNEEKRRK